MSGDVSVGRGWAVRPAGSAERGGRGSAARGRRRRAGKCQRAHREQRQRRSTGRGAAPGARPVPSAALTCHRPAAGLLPLPRRGSSAPFPRLPVHVLSSAASRDSPAGSRLSPSSHPSGAGRCLHSAPLQPRCARWAGKGPGGEAAVLGGVWRGAGSAAAPLGRGQSRRARPALGPAGGAPGRGERPPVGFRPWNSAPEPCLARALPASSLMLSSVALEGLRAFSKKDAP